MTLLPLFGLTWIFGVLAINQSLIAFQYLFAICNSLQVGDLHSDSVTLHEKEETPTFIQ